MDKLYAIKIKQSDGTYGAAIPVSVLAENVDWNSTLSLVDILGQVDTSESIQDQINNLKNTKATQASVNALDQKVDNAVDAITHNSEIANAREGADGTEYSTLKERLDTEYDDLQSKNASFSAVRQNRRFILIGDSYGMRHSKNWRSLVEQAFRTSDGIESYVVFSNAIGSYGFAPDTLKFLTILQNGKSGLTTEQIESVTDIVVVGGWNDARELKRGKTALELQEAILTFCDYVAENFPNAIITLEYVGWQRGTGGQDGVTRDNLLNARLIYDATYHRILRHGTSMFKVMLNCSIMDSSNFHPNDNIAADQLYYALVNDLSGIGFMYNYKYAMGSSAFTPSSAGNMNVSSCEIQDGIVRFDVTITNITGVSNSGVVGTFDLTKLPFALWETRTFHGHVLENGADLYCILNTNGNLNIYGATSIPSTAWTLVIRETFPMIYT